MESNIRFITLPHDNNKYIITDDITKATHWVGYEESRFKGELETEANRAYELICLYGNEPNNRDYYIRANNTYSMVYMVVKGVFLIKM